MSSGCDEVRSTVCGFGFRQFFERHCSQQYALSPSRRRTAGAVGSSRSHASTALDSA
jgi:transcriptional regulator GlxA family with amidase domain